MYIRNFILINIDALKNVNESKVFGKYSRFKIIGTRIIFQRKQWYPTPVLLPGKPHGQRCPVGCSHGVAKSQTRLSDFTFTFHFHALEKEMATHSNVLAWRIPGMGESGGVPSMGSQRVGHDWSDLAAAAAELYFNFSFPEMQCTLGWLDLH